MEYGLVDREKNVWARGACITTGSSFLKGARISGELLFDLLAELVVSLFKTG